MSRSGAEGKGAVRGPSPIARWGWEERLWQGGGKKGGVVVVDGPEEADKEVAVPQIGGWEGTCMDP